MKTPTKMPGLSARVAAQVPDSELPPPPPKEEEIIPELRELALPTADARALGQLISESAEWAVQEREARAARAPITVQIKKIMGKHSIGRVQYDGIPVHYFNAPRTSLSTEALRTNLSKRGLSSEVIEAVIAASMMTKDCYTLRIGKGEE